MNDAPHVVMQVHVLWPDNGIWYRAIVKRFNPTTLSAYLLYTETDEEEKDANVKEMIDEKGIAFSKSFISGAPPLTVHLQRKMSTTTNSDIQFA